MTTTATPAVRSSRAASGDRFYQLELRHRPALKGDIGSLIRIQGLLVGGEGAGALLLLPDAPDDQLVDTHKLSAEEWTDWLQRSDDPEVLVMPAKAFHRKLRYEISGFVQQKVWLADGLKCMYCTQLMGKVPLTIDHFIPLELGGKNDTSNYLSACKKCNKDKGAEDPRAFCAGRSTRLTYEGYVTYLEHRQLT